jgi:flagellar motor switch protein FliN/FliY
MEKINDDTIRQTIASSLIETFDAMMTMNLEAVQEEAIPDLDDSRMVGLIHFGGEVVGTMSLSLSEVFAQTVACAMLGIESEEIKSKAEINDVLGELANIVAGNLKTEFLDAGLSCAISTASITSGSNFKIDPVRHRTTAKLFFPA